MTFAGVQYRRLYAAASFGMTVDYLINLAGPILCGHVGGEQALAAANLSVPVMELASFIACLITTGAAVRFSAEMGRYHLRRARGFFTLGLVLSLSAGALLLALLNLFATPLLTAFGASGALLECARAYWRGFSFVVALYPLSYFCATLVYADGGQKLYLSAKIAQLVVGTLAAALLAHLGLGLFGCAFGLALGHLAAIGAYLCRFRSPASALAFSRHFCRWDILSVCRDSLGDASRFLGRMALYAILNVYVLATFGASALAILAVVVMIVNFSDLLDAVGNAAQPLVGVYALECNEVGVRRVMNCVMSTSLRECFLTVLFVQIFPTVVMGMAGIKDPATLASGVSAVRLAALALFGFAFIYPFNAYYPFVKRVALTSVVTLLAELLLPLAAFYPATRLWGEKGLWLTIGLSPLVAAAIGAVWVYLCTGRGKAFPYFLNRAHEARLTVHDLVLTPEAICTLSEKIAALSARAGLLVEETLMAIRERNEGHKVIAEVTVEQGARSREQGGRSKEQGASVEGLFLTLRDDGLIFDITDADAKIASLRTYLVSNLMNTIRNRRNLTTTGYNRNAFRL